MTSARATPAPITRIAPRRTILPALAAALATWLLSATASAQDLQPQVAPYYVQTQDGSMYQGQLVESVVGQHVTIRLASGELRTFQAADVAAQGNAGRMVAAPPSLAQQEVDALNAVAAARALALAGTPGAPPVAYAGPDAVQIHITKSNDGEGTLLGETASGWQPVCTIPCTTTVDPKVDYRLHNSSAFRFPAGPPLDLVVDPGARSALKATGWSMVGVGLTAWIPGLLFQLDVFSGKDSPNTPVEQQQEQHQESSNRAIGFAFYGVSTALFITGVVLLNLHPASTLSTTSGQRIVKNNFTLTPNGFTF